MFKINFLAAVFGAVTTFAMVFIPVFLAEQGLSGLEIGILVGLGLIISIFASIPAGIISDRFSTRAAFAVSLLLVAVFFIGLNFASGFLALFILFVILGMGKETTNRFIEIFTLRIKSELAGKKFGEFSFYRYAGSATGGLVGGIAIAVLAFTFTFNLLALAVLLLLIPVYFLREVPKNKINLFQYSKDFLKVKNIAFAVLLFFFTFHWGAEYTAYGLFLKNYLGLDTVLSGVYIAIPILFLGIFSFLGGKLIDRKFDYKKIFIAAIFLSGLGHILMVNPDVFVSFFWRLVHEAGDGLFFVTQLVWVSLLFDKQRIGGNYGIMFMIMTLGAFTGAVVSGPLGEASNYALPLILSGIIVVAEAVILSAYIFRKNFNLRKGQKLPLH
jgi:MFS family permease